MLDQNQRRRAELRNRIEENNIADAIHRRGRDVAQENALSRARNVLAHLEAEHPVRHGEPLRLAEVKLRAEAWRDPNFEQVRYGHLLNLR